MTHDPRDHGGDALITAFACLCGLAVVLAVMADIIRATP